MAFADYTELRATIGRWLEREDLEGSIPDFIRLAEVKLDRLLRSSSMETLGTVTITSGIGTLPTDYRHWKRVISNVNTARLDYITPEYAAEMFPTGIQGLVFTIMGTKIYTYQSGVTQVTMLYYASIPPLTVVADTNWLLTRHPDLYLYGALLESAPYMQDDARLAVWGNLFDKSLDQVTADDNMYKLGEHSRSKTMGATP